MLMLIGNKLEYALKILIQLAGQPGDGGLVSSKEIARECGISPKYIPQLVAALARKGWVSSSRGPRGGIKLAVPPEKITVQQVMDTMGNPLVIKECLFKDRPCKQSSTCPLFPLWTKIQGRVEEVLYNTNIKDLMEDQLRLQDQEKRTQGL